MVTLSPQARWAFWATLPVLLMPSMALVWGQLHKDVWAMFGVLAVLCAWAKIMVNQPFSWFLLVVLLVLGNLSVWLVRPYALKLLMLGQLAMLSA